jgi:hypothetical protein
MSLGIPVDKVDETPRRLDEMETATTHRHPLSASTRSAQPLRRLASEPGKRGHCETVSFCWETRH